MLRVEVEMQMDGRPTITIVYDTDQADADALCVHLYEESKEILGWYIGPVGIERDRLVVPYLAKTRRTSAASAILQAMGTAIVRQRHICIVDPCDLWAMV